MCVSMISISNGLIFSIKIVLSKCLESENQTEFLPYCASSPGDHDTIIKAVKVPM